SGTVDQVRSELGIQGLAPEENPPDLSVGIVNRQMLYRTSALDSPYPAHRLDSRLSAEALHSPDAREGFDSFRQRRAPAFPGRVSSDLPDDLPWRNQ
ncbi:hypothetical protein ACGFIZ_30735, partial [Micromonospora sp. NPDC048830]